MSYALNAKKNKAKKSMLVFAFLFMSGAIVPQTVYAHNQTLEDCEEGQILVDGGHGQSGNQHCAYPEEGEENEQEETELETLTLTVQSRYIDESELTGMFTTLGDSEGETIDEGYTTRNFTLTEDEDYQITVANFEGIIFSHWEDETTSELDWGAIRDINIDENTTVTAYFHPASEQEEEEQSSNGGGRNWGIIFAHRDAFLEQELTGENIPESDTGARMYDFAIGGTLAFVSQGYGWAYGDQAWYDLTEKQKVWLLENIQAILSGDV